MYLKALEIQGFKSFPDKTVLTFGEDITAIVGPNGSGKSNISDAIRWVMGEQSTRALRGGKMEDVIFGGTAKRHQSGYAEVSLVLDNTSHSLPMDESEVMITRRYYRSGESEYYINRRTVRLKDINELFMDTGLGREGYAIIGQGRIDEILSVRSTDRREIFEEAAGISRFRHRKEDAQRKLERTDENLVRINDKLGELELQVEPLRKQSETAEKYLLLREELRGLEIAVWLDALEHIRSSKVKLDAGYQEALRQREKAKMAQEKSFSAAEEYASQMRNKDMQAEAERQEMQERQRKAGELEAALAVLRRDIQHNLESLERLHNELEQQEEREHSLEDQIQQRRDRLSALQTQLTVQRQEMTELQQQAQDAMQHSGVLAQELEQLRRREALESADASQAKALLSALAAAAQEVLDRDEAVRREVHTLTQRVQELGQEIQKLEQSLRQAKEERDSAGNVVQGYHLRLNARQKKADQQHQRQTQLQMEEHALMSRIKLLTEMEQMHEGYSKSVKLVMNEVRRGTLHHIHGAVAELVRVSEQYTVAVETALGAAMQHLVVDREEDGKAVLQYLKQRDGGRATILPLSAIRPGQLRERQNLVHEPGFVGIGDELVSFDAQYRNVFSNLLGRVVVMEDLDSAIATARKYHHQFRIVTLDGQVLNPGGSMTGGSANRSAGILSRANELEHLKRQHSELQERLAQEARALAEIDRETVAARYELEHAQAQQRHWEDEILTVQAQLTGAVQRQAELQSRYEAQCAELKQLEQRADQIEQDTQAARSRVQKLEGEAAALKSEAAGKEQGQQTLQERSIQITQALTRCSAAVAALEAELDATKTGLAELEQLKNSLTGNQDQSREMLSEYRTKNERITNQISEKEQELMQLRQEIKVREEHVSGLNQEKLTLEGRRIQASRESQTCYEELSRMEREVSRLEQQCTSLIMEERQLLDKLWENYELSHEAAKQQRIEVESISKATRRITELKRDISKLGTVNVGSIEEFQRVNERYVYLTEQRDDVAKAKKELEHIVDGITTEMKRIFSKEFESINAAFMETFQELFGGGRATLELEDPNDILNCGIEIRVQPPGKALKVISLLSGGEKAFVAIALYFAILKIRPTPFVVMDEIEAALDDNNVARFAHYMRRMSERTQFIVITHRRGTMEEADVLYGVTMQEQGISRMLTIRLHDIEQQLKL